jgi:SAM-dependent methyltransferase
MGVSAYHRAVRNSLLLRGYRLGRMLGIDPRATLNTVRNLGWYMRDLRAFRDQALAAETQLPFGGLSPCLGDSGSDGGTASGHYFHQDLLVARRIFERRPDRHIDIGSRVDGFVAHVASFRTIEVFDIRPLTKRIPNVVFRQADVMSPPPELAECADSASCLHALEHLGLGRYGDPIDPDGHLKGLAALHRLLRPGGTLYLSLPIGPARIEFNAHRVLSLEYLLAKLRPRFEVIAFSYVDDTGDLHENVELDEAAIRTNCGCKYGCGIFELRRI